MRLGLAIAAECLRPSVALLAFACSPKKIEVDPGADAGLARSDGGRRRTERGGCGDDGQRCRVDHITTAAEADHGFGCMIWEAAER